MIQTKNQIFFFDGSSLLSEIIENNLQLIPVINRFGIKLGIGDKSIASICRKEDIDIEFFLAILNTYLNEDYFPESKLKRIDIELVTDYLKKTDNYLIHGPLHNLEKHLNAFVSMSDPKNQQLGYILKLFEKFKSEFMNQTSKGIIEENVSLALLSDIKSIIIKHLNGNYNENMCYAVLFSVNSLQKDLQRHNRIREKILKPAINYLTEAGIEDWQSLLNNEQNKNVEKNQPISQREIDVLKLIALGLLNKEIADKLNISLNTVLSHRKNITAKLGIKTVSGLIFYCITNGYISAEEIEF